MVDISSLLMEYFSVAWGMSLLAPNRAVVALVASPTTLSYEPRHEKTGFLHMRKQRRR